MSNVDGELLGVLLDIKADTAKTLQAIEDLAGPQGRVTALEQAASRQKLYTTMIVPLVTGLNALLHHFGIKL